MKILITGGAGFIGSHLIDKLLLEEHNVFCIDNFDDYYNIKEKERNIENHLSYNNYQLLRGDILDKTFVSEVFSELIPDVVIHLAARSGVRSSIIDPELYFHTNVLGTLNLLEAIKNIKPVKFIFASSSSVYGLNQKVPFSEEDPTLLPASPYAASKISCEALCRSYAHIYNISTICLRFFTVFGTRQRPDLVIRKFIENFLQDKEITIFGDGNSSRDYTHVSDIVNGIKGAINIKHQGYSIFNLGNSTPVNLSELIRIIEKNINKKIQIKLDGFQNGDVPVTFANIDRAKKYLNYNPEINIDDGIREMIEWMKTN